MGSKSFWVGTCSILGWQGVPRGAKGYQGVPRQPEATCPSFEDLGNPFERRICENIHLSTEFGKCILAQNRRNPFEHKIWERKKLSTGLVKSIWAQDQGNSFERRIREIHFNAGSGKLIWAQDWKTSAGHESVTELTDARWKAIWGKNVNWFYFLDALASCSFNHSDSPPYLSSLDSHSIHPGYNPWYNPRSTLTFGLTPGTKSDPSSQK